MFVLFSYFDQNFIGKFIWKSDFWNFDHETWSQNRNLYSGRHLETVESLIFADMLNR